MAARLIRRFTPERADEANQQDQADSAAEHNNYRPSRRKTVGIDEG